MNTLAEPLGGCLLGFAGFFLPFVFQKMEGKAMDPKPFDLGERTFQFADELLDWVEKCPRTFLTVELLRQVIRSGTSVGANTEEANEAQSQKDEASKLGIALKEARESRYWLRLLRKRISEQKAVDGLIQEATELANILKSRIRNLHNGKR